MGEIFHSCDGVNSEQGGGCDIRLSVRGGGEVVVFQLSLCHSLCIPVPHKN